MPRGNQKRIGLVFNASDRKASRVAKAIEEVVANLLGDDECTIYTDGFRPSGWELDNVSVSFPGIRSRAR